MARIEGLLALVACWLLTSSSGLLTTPTHVNGDAASDHDHASAAATEEQEPPLLLRTTPLLRPTALSSYSEANRSHDGRGRGRHRRATDEEPSAAARHRRRRAQTTTADGGDEDDWPSRTFSLTDACFALATDPAARVADLSDRDLSDGAIRLVEGAVLRCADERRCELEARFVAAAAR
jgi:hypothetical protein